MTKNRFYVMIVLSYLAPIAALAQWPQPEAPVIPETDGYVLIPDAALRPEANHTYKAIFDATQFPDNPSELLPALNNAGSELNALGVEGIPKKNWKFVIVVHGPAIDGLLNDQHYKEKFGIGNPNLKVLSRFRHENIELYVCGQNLAMSKIDPATLSSDVKVASDALIVLMHFQNAGYALLRY